LTATEYIQLKAFARIDGAWLSLLLIAGFACYVVGLTSPTYGFLFLLTFFVISFFVGRRLKRFRDNGLDGTMSFLRGWAYVIMMFFYGGLLFALAQYAYLTYMDKGYILMTINDVLSTPENTAVMKQLGMTDQINESLHLLGTMRPIDFALNMLTTLIMAGAVLGLPIAAVLQKRRVTNKS
jgi:hypothetical protein